MDAAGPGGWAVASGGDGGAAAAALAEDDDSGSGSGSQSDDGMDDMLELSHDPSRSAASSERGGPFGGHHGRGTLNFFLKRTSQLDEASGHSQFSSMFKDLKSDDSTRQIMALTELSEYLSLSSEEALLSFPMEMFIPVLIGLLENPGHGDESTGQVMLLCCRCLYNVVDILPPTARIIIAAGGLPVLSSKLLNVEYIDVAEMAVAIVEWMSEDQPLQVLRAGCLQAILAFLDFFQMATQRQAANAASLMLAPLLPAHILEQHVRPVLPTLATLVQHSDLQVAQSICECWRRVLDNTIAVHGQPPSAQTSPCSSSALARMAAKGKRRAGDRAKRDRDDAADFGPSASTASTGNGSAAAAQLPLASVLEEMCPAGVLGNLLVLLGSAISAPTPQSAVVAAEVLYILAVLTNYSETFAEEVLSQDICEMLRKMLLNVGLGQQQLSPSQPPAGVLRILAVVVSILPAVQVSDMNSCECEEKRLALFAASPGYLDSLAEAFLPLLLEIHETSMEPTIQSLCVSLLLSFFLVCRKRPELVSRLLDPPRLASFLANQLLVSASRSALLACLAVCEELLQSHPDPYSVLFARHGVAFAVQRLAACADDKSQRRAAAAAAGKAHQRPRHARSRAHLVEEAAQRIAAAHFGQQAQGSAALEALGSVAAKLQSSPEELRPCHHEALAQLSELLLAEEGVTAFEFSSSSAAAALHAFLYPCDPGVAPAEGGADWRALFGERLQLFIDCVGKSPSGALAALVRLSASVVQRIEQQSLTLFPIHALMEASLPPHLRVHGSPQLHGRSDRPHSGRGGMGELHGAFGGRVGGRGRDSGVGASPLLSVLRLLAKPVKVRISPQGAPGGASEAIGSLAGSSAAGGPAPPSPGSVAPGTVTMPNFRTLLAPSGGKAALSRLLEPKHHGSASAVAGQGVAVGSAAAAAVALGPAGASDMAAPMTTSPATRLRDYLASKVLPTVGRKRSTSSAGAASGAPSERRSGVAAFFSRADGRSGTRFGGGSEEPWLAGGGSWLDDGGDPGPAGAAGPPPLRAPADFFGGGRGARDRDMFPEVLEAVLLVEPFAMVSALEDYIWDKHGPRKDGGPRGPSSSPSGAAAAAAFSAAASAAACDPTAPAGASATEASATRPAAHAGAAAAGGQQPPPGGATAALGAAGGASVGGSSSAGSVSGSSFSPREAPDSFDAPPASVAAPAPGAEGEATARSPEAAGSARPAGSEQKRVQKVQIMLGGRPLGSRASVVQSLVSNSGRLWEQRRAPQAVHDDAQGRACGDRFLVAAEDSSGASDGGHPDPGSAQGVLPRDVCGTIWGRVHSMTYEFLPPETRLVPKESLAFPSPDQAVDPPSFEPTDFDALVRRHGRTVKTIAAMQQQASAAGAAAPGTVCECDTVAAPEPCVAGDDQLTTMLQLISSLQHLCEYLNVSELGQPQVEDCSFHCNTLTSILLRQLSDPLAVCTGSVPAWCSKLAAACPFLFPHSARRVLHSSCGLGLSRALHYIQQRALAQHAHSQEAQRRLEGEVAVASIPRQKVRISRQRMLDSAVKVMNLYGGGTPILEVEYVGEVGTGLGPTLEFYAQVAEMLRTSEPRVFRDGVPMGMVFPEPWQPDWLEKGEDKQAQQILERLRLLGHVVAKCILDSRLVDIQLHPLFWRMILGRGPLSQNSLREVDPALFNQLNSLRSMSAEDLEGLCVDFTLPGHPQIELKPGGSSISLTADGVDEYINLVSEMCLVKACLPQVAAFRQAFAELLSLDACQIWSEKELSTIIMGASVNDDSFWTMEHLGAHIKAQHGYSAQSACFQHLLATMNAFEPEDRKKFLTFVSGAPTLPVGGFAGLKPPLTVVRKEAPPAPQVPDEFMPSVMTCANYLKLPEYSTAEVLKEKLLLAMNEGQSAFLLS